MRPAALALLALVLLSGCAAGADPGSANRSAPEQAEPSGEESIERFGSEATGARRAAILAAFRDYLGALGHRDYPDACSRLSAAVVRSLRRFAAPATTRSGCAQLLPAVLAPSAAEVSRDQAGGEVTKVRVSGSRSFVVFRAPGAKLYQLTMLREAGEWKAATLSGAILVPSPAMFGP
jgi:hypothetical protein